VKRLLIVSFTVPPTKGPSPGRAGHFVRHLPKSGWEAIVLTPRHPRRRVTVEKTREHRDCAIPLRRVLDPNGIPYWLQESHYRDVLFSLRKPPPRGEIGAVLPGLYGKQSLDAEEIALEEPPAPRTAGQRLALSLRCNPDARVGWISPGLQAARAVCRALSPDAVYSISPPVTAHRIAMRVARNLKIPWIADLREPWQGWGPKLIDAGRRARILRGARAYRLPPSFDAADLGLNQTVIQPGRRPITLIHAGSLTRHGRDPLVLCDALRHLLDAQKDDVDALRVRLLGSHDSHLITAIAARHLSGIVTLEQEVPWEISLETQAGSSALLLALGPGDRGRIPDRLLEAFAVRRPVIAFGPADTELQEVLRATAVGNCHADSISLASAWADLMRSERILPPALNEEALSSYCAERVVESVVKLLSV